MPPASRRTLTRRAFVQAAAVALGATLAACSGAGTPTPSPTHPPTIPPTPVLPRPVPTASPTPVIGPTEHVIYVDMSHASADDANPGTIDRPLKTVGRATAIAADNTLRNLATRILVAPGVYRESVTVQPKNPQATAPISIQAQQNGTAVIAGSDVWTGWQRQGTTSVYTHPWPYTWGLAPYPPGWQGNVDLKPIVRRREMIFINGGALTQVLASGDLRPGTFFVSEQAKTVSLMPPQGVIVETATVEVAVRAGIFSANGARNLTVTGLVFRHDATAVGGTAVLFTNCTGGVVEDCQFLWNNWAGMSFQSVAPQVSQAMAARRNVANYNGGIGMAAARVKDVLYEDNETSYNSWRAALGQMARWSNAGLKHLFVHGGTYRRHRAIGNQAPGCWFDTDCADIEIEQAFLCANVGPGLFIEASQGPTRVADSAIGNNRGDAGLFSNGGAEVTLQGNTLYGNTEVQLQVVKGARTARNWETNAAMTINPERWTLRQNLIVGSDTAPRLAEIADSARFFGTLVSDENTWFSPKKSGYFTIDNTNVDFAAWRAASGQDADSQFRDPRFVDPAHNDFHLRDDSPLRQG